MKKIIVKHVSAKYILINKPIQSIIMSEKVLVKLSVRPYGNYNGPWMFEFITIPYTIASIIKNFINQYGEQTILFYAGNDYDVKLENFKIKIIYDENLINANNIFNENFHVLASLRIAKILLLNMYYLAYPGEECDELNIDETESIMECAKVLGLLDE